MNDDRVNKIKIMYVLIPVPVSKSPFIENEHKTYSEKSKSGVIHPEILSAGFAASLFEDKHFERIYKKVARRFGNHLGSRTYDVKNRGSLPLMVIEACSKAVGLDALDPEEIYIQNLLEFKRNKEYRIQVLKECSEMSKGARYKDKYVEVIRQFLGDIPWYKRITEKLKGKQGDDFENMEGLGKEIHEHIIDGYFILHDYLQQKSCECYG